MVNVLLYVVLQAETDFKRKIGFYRSIVIQTCMAYDDNELVLSSIESLPAEWLMKMANSQAGSYIYTKFADLANIADKRKKAFAESETMMV
mgnify:FL=1